jgi:hypothetical protein
MQVNQEPRLQPRPERQQRARQIQGHAIEFRPQQTTEADVDAAHQREWRQEQLAELAVRDPRRSRLQALERQRVDQHGPAVLEQHVVRRRVLERHPVIERRPLQPQCQEGRVLQLAERPLVGIGDELHARRLDDAVRTAVGRELGAHILVGHHVSSSGQLRV